MRSTFRAYFRPSEEEFNELWKSALVVPDASFLLDLYRVSEKTRDVFKQILAQLVERIHVPHQFALEFARNRTTAIAEHISNYETAANELSKMVERFENKSRHPFVSEDTLKHLRNAVRELEEASKSQQGLLHDDPLTAWVGSIVTGARIGAPFGREELMKLYVEGKERFRNKIPPGYADFGTKPEPRCYGDLVAWKQVLCYAKNQQRHVILVTSEQKEDWWLKERHRWTIGPRPELIEEFEIETNQKFYAYNTQNFLTRAASATGVEIPEGALREVAAVEQAHRERDAREKAKSRVSDLKSAVAPPMQGSHEDPGVALKSDPKKPRV